MSRSKKAALQLPADAGYLQNRATELSPNALRPMQHRWSPSVCPAHAGMSPVRSRRLRRCRCLPRTRGDEPYPTPFKAVLTNVCPAHAGMSPELAAVEIRRVCLPRTRGDEPGVAERVIPENTSAPHTRG